MSPTEAGSQAERDVLIEALARHRGFLLYTAAGLTEEQARTRSTASELTIASLLKHVADTEEQWMDFGVGGAEAFAASGVYEAGVDWDAVDAEAAVNDGDWSGSEWEDDRFTLAEGTTLAMLRQRVDEVAQKTESVLRTADLELSHRLPDAPWFESGAEWSLRRVALHVLAEISQHAGHADIIREAIDGQRTMG